MTFKKKVDKFLESFEVNNSELGIVPVGVKFFSKGTQYPKEDPLVSEASIPWCGAVKLASQKELVVVTRKNIGCPAGGIALGLVDKDDTKPLEGNRQYTSLMGKPASPSDFTSGYVYAFKDCKRYEFALFGDKDCGRYKTLGASLNALSGMTGIGRKVMDAVAAFSPDVTDYTPDVVILGLTPKQALRAIQGYAFENGERVEMNTIGIRGVCADVTAYPFLKQKLNCSFFCLGARALGGWEGDRMALGMPYHDFEKMVNGMIESRKGFPYKLYP
jgi:uncharacterized protein (DUF169 family)